MPWANDFAVGVNLHLHVVSRMSWQNDFAICVLSFSFIDHPRGVFLLDALAMSFCISCVCISSPYMLARLQFLIIIISLRHH